MNSDPKCIFCAILDKRIPARIVHEDDAVVAFEDANPQAPVHLLIVPRRHLASIQDMGAADEDLVGRLFFTAKTIAKARGLDASGYRLVINNGAGAGQTVFHVHLHLLSGRRFHWPPG